jgi:5-methylcytosine-specific restriction endonuclease McrA
MNHVELRRREYADLDTLADRLEEIPLWTEGARQWLNEVEAIANSKSGRFPLVRYGERDAIPALTRRLVLRRDNHHCKRCASDVRLQLDHVVPWSFGGPDRSTNLQTLCEWCNSDRSNFREAGLPRLIGVTAVCDPCLYIHDGNMSDLHNRAYMWTQCPRCRAWGEDWERDEHVPAYCGTCDWTSWVSDPRRIL